MTKVISASVLVLTAAMLGGCSADGVKRVAYESVLGAGEEQCRKTQTPNCPAPASYDDYQRNRTALATPEK
jgi:hypothetical protein